MPDISVRLGLYKRRAISRTGPVDGTPSCGFHHFRLLPIDDLTGHVVRLGRYGQVCHGRGQLDVAILAEPANEDGQEIPDGGQVNALVEGTDVRCPVGENGYRDIVGAANLGRQGGARGTGSASTRASGGARPIVRDVRRPWT